MLLQDGAHGYLHRSERNLCSADLFVFRELETTCLEILVRAKTILVMMSRTKNMWRIAHMSGVAKSTRERGSYCHRDYSWNLELLCSK